MWQDVPWENPPNIEDEKPNNSLNIIDTRLTENFLQHISRLIDKREHESIEKRHYLQQL